MGLVKTLALRRRGQYKGVLRKYGECGVVGGYS